MRSMLDGLSKNERNDLENDLLEIQDGKCFICQQPINKSVHSVNIDHIIPLANDGPDNKSNFAITHEPCNKSKLDADLNVARVLSKLQLLTEKIKRETNKIVSLKDVLLNEDGSKYNFKFEIVGENLKYSFDKLGDIQEYTTQIYNDKLSKEKTAFLEVPIEYLFHDDKINPRGINSSISALVKEFYKGNPQLHLSLARIDEGKIKIFDGQHKAVAQILLGQKKILVRLFINPDVKRLTETNTNAGSSLRQVAFDKATIRQLNHVLYAEKIKDYQNAKGLKDDDFSFSEQNLVDYFKADSNKIKKYIIDALKNNITLSPDNKLRAYINFEGKSKKEPISHSSFDKTFLTLLIDSKNILKHNLDYAPINGKPIRTLEEEQVIKLLNIVAEEIYINKFDCDIGTYRIEQRIIDGKDTEITDPHLIAYRIGKEEVLYNFVKWIRRVIIDYNYATGIYDEDNLFQKELPHQLWNNIRNFISNFSKLPLWKDRAMSRTIFSGKLNYDFWNEIFEKGQTPDGKKILLTPIEIKSMIKG